MTTKEINIEIDKNIDMNKKELYEILLETFPEERVKFAMYNRFEYLHSSTEEKEKRIDQESFKRDLIERYKTCIVTNISYKVCQACHIIPHSKCDNKDKYNVNNGLLLRSDLHILFDNDNLKINPDTLQVELSNEILNDNDMKIYHEFNGKKLNINENSVVYLKNIY